MISPAKYLQQVSQEIQKVSWPTFKQTQQKTLLVVGVCLALAFYIGALDIIFQKMMEMVL